MERIVAGDGLSASADVVAENVEALRGAFPEAFTEDGIDFDVLRQLLGGGIAEGDEKYGLNWHGKRDARRIALTPSTGTLRPCPDESVDWDTTQNLMIEGDNLEVLKLLQKSYSGKVKLIYIDPPYNTGNDFVYKDDYQDNIRNYLELTGQADSEGKKLSTSVETSGRFHTDWLNMMYPRLKLARNLLRDDGVIAISIDDGEQAHLHALCADIFGENNHVATVVWQKRYVSNVTAKWLSDMHDFVVLYAKDREKVVVNAWKRTEEQVAAYKNPDNDSRGRWRAQDLSASKPYSAGQFTILGPTGREFRPPPNRYWRCNETQFEKWQEDGRIWWGVNRDARPMLKGFLSESDRGITPHTWWGYDFAGHNKEATLEVKDLFDGDAPFDTPKPVRLMTRIVELLCADTGLVLDFFAGSGAMAEAVISRNAATQSRLRYAMVQIQEPIERHDFAILSDVTKERLRRAGVKVKKEHPEWDGDVGFRVFKLDSSNIRAWSGDAGDVEESLLTSLEHVVEGRTDEDLLYEVLLKLGLDLCVPGHVLEFAGVEVSSVGGGVMMSCLSRSLSTDQVEAVGTGIVEWIEELSPSGDVTVVFRDSAFENDVAKTNMAAILEQGGVTTVRSI